MSPSRAPDHDLARRLRRRAEPEPRGPARRGRRAPARVGVRDRAGARSTAGGRRAQRRLRRRRRGDRRRRRLHHGPQDVRRRCRARGTTSWTRLVGRGPAVPRAGLRPHPPRARAARDGGRHDLPLRHRRDRGRARAGPRGGGRPGRRRSPAARARCASTSRAGLLDELVPARRPGRARRGRAAARGRRRPAARAGRGRRLAGGHARPLSTSARAGCAMVAGDPSEDRPKAA